MEDLFSRQGADILVRKDGPSAAGFRPAAHGLDSQAFLRAAEDAERLRAVPRGDQAAVSEGQAVHAGTREEEECHVCGQL